MLFKTRQNKDKPGQTMVEFALALPIVLVIVFGVIEFGFLLWSYSSVNSAAREAARYGIAIGDGTISGQRYYDCEGIRNAAMKAGAFAGMEVSDIYIHYDDGSILDTADPSYTPKYNTCEELAAHGGDDEIEFGDRIVISITHDYHPIAALLGFDIQPFNMIARSNRTIVKSAIVSTGGEGGGGTGEGTACFSLFTTHSGEGADPTVSPAKSSGCDVIGEYVGGEIVTLTAAPNPGWSVAAWTGDTYDDASTSTENYLNMPGAPHTVSVIYANVNPTCYVLTLSTSGTGTGTLAADPANSSGCDPGEYLAGTYIELIATPDAGSEIGGWTGTNNDGSTSSPNYKTMPASDDTVTVEFDLTSTTCYSLTIAGHTGIGTDPVPSASNCAGGLYVENTVVTLNATAGAGYEVSGWNGTDNDASTSTTNTVTMDGDKAVSVDYVVSFTPDPPINVKIPNDLDLGEWHWNKGLPACQKIDLRWAANPSWAPSSPLYYNVYRSDTFHDQINGLYWDANQGVSLGQTISLGVQAVFSGGVTSLTHEVTYICLEEVLDPWGSVVK